VLTGNPMWDALGSMSIGALLIVVAIGIGTEIKALLIGQSAEPESEERVRQFLLAQPGVEKIFRLLTYQLGRSLFGRPAGLIAGLLVGLSGPLIIYEEGATTVIPPGATLIFEVELLGIR